MKYQNSKSLKLALTLSLSLLSSSQIGLAEEGKTKDNADSAQTTQAQPGSAEKVNIDNIKEKYWARGDQSEVGVVQNRLYSKEHKLELSAFGGFLSTDPFLSVKSAGGTVGYHLSEYVALEIMGWKTFVSPSSALLTFQDTIGATTNNNPPRYFVGSEALFSFLYGKLSLMGKAIIYYDMHLIAGAGVTNTDSGSYFTPTVGIGQQVYLSQHTAIRVDYRLMRYNETIIEKVITPKLGQPVGTRTNWTNSVTLGVDFLVDIFK